MAGKINYFLVDFKTNFWIIDTCALNHMVSSKDLMSSSIPLSSSSQNLIHLPNSGITQITHKGTCQLDKNQLLKDVLYIPMFKYNLLYVSKLTRDLQCYASFYSDFFLFQDLYTNKVKGIGKVNDELYMPSTNSSAPVTSSSLQDPTICLSPHDTSVKSSIWHQRLGHAPVSSSIRYILLNTL